MEGPASSSCRARPHRRLCAILLLVALLGGLACSRTPTSPPTTEQAAQQAREQAPRRPETPRLLLIGLDGATWRIVLPEIRMGRLPNMAQIVRQGAHADLTSMEPMLSPRIWTTIVTGKTPEKHGIVDFAQLVERDGKREKRLMTSNTRKVKALWQILSERGISNSFVGWWASWPAEPTRGAIVTSLSWPFKRQKFLLDMSDAEVRRVAGRTFPESLMAEIDPYNVSFEDLEPEEIARLGLTEQTWCYPKDRSQLAAARLIAAKLAPRVQALYLQGIDAISHPFWQDGNRVARYYEYTDRALTFFLDNAPAGAQVLICSDHGFQGLQETPSQPPRAGSGPAPGGQPFLLQATPGSHDIQGILLAMGSRIRRGHRLKRASVLDICPTILAMLDLPMARDMDGRILRNLFNQDSRPPQNYPTIPTYESGEPRSPGEEEPLESPLDEEIISALKGLGYAI
jgi:predicted AlkP superfamily phosphohydrolase/phosphomutase